MRIKLPFLEVSIKKSNALKNKEKVHSKIYNRDRYNKVFCIGFGKTGTTSLKKTLEMFGFKTGNQQVAEILAIEWAGHGYPHKILKYCKTAEAFQDSPFFHKNLFPLLDKEFPKSKFILSTRESDEQWFNSLLSFHKKKFGNGTDELPNEKTLLNALYGYEGMVLDTKKIFFDYPKTPLYDRKAYCKIYNSYNDKVREYFKNRKDDFIEVNVSKKEDFIRLSQFLNVKSSMNDFPWYNKTNK